MKTSAAYEVYLNAPRQRRNADCTPLPSARAALSVFPPPLPSPILNPVTQSCTEKCRRLHTRTLCRNSIRALCNSGITEIFANCFAYTTREPGLTTLCHFGTFSAFSFGTNNSEIRTTKFTEPVTISRFLPINYLRRTVPSASTIRTSTTFALADPNPIAIAAEDFLPCTCAVNKNKTLYTMKKKSSPSTRGIKRGAPQQSSASLSPERTQSESCTDPDQRLKHAPATSDCPLYVYAHDLHVCFCANKVFG